MGDDASERNIAFMLLEDGQMVPITIRSGRTFSNDTLPVWQKGCAKAGRYSSGSGREIFDAVED
jgi:hypothetical protein